MSFPSGKQNREFQLELLRIQLKHRREIAIFSTSAAIGVSFAIFGATILMTALTSWASEKEILALLLPIAIEYMIVGIVLVIVSIVFYHLISYREEKEINTLRDKFIKNDI